VKVAPTNVLERRRVSVFKVDTTVLRRLYSLCWKRVVSTLLRLLPMPLRLVVAWGVHFAKSVVLFLAVLLLLGICTAEQRKEEVGMCLQA